MQKAVVVLDGLQFLNFVDCNKRGRSHWHFMVSQTDEYSQNEMLNNPLCASSAATKT